MKHGNCNSSFGVPKWAGKKKKKKQKKRKNRHARLWGGKRTVPNKKKR